MSNTQGTFVTPKDVESHLNLIERVADKFDVEDDFLAAVLANQVTMGRVIQNQNDILSALGATSQNLTGGKALNTYPFDFSADVPASTPTNDPYTVSREIPFDAQVISVIIGWANGANNLVGAQLRKESGERFVPRDKDNDYLTANAFTHAFQVSFEVSKGDTLVAQYVNNDPDYDHFVNMIPTIVDKTPGGSQ